MHIDWRHQLRAAECISGAAPAAFRMSVKHASAHASANLIAEHRLLKLSCLHPQDGWSLDLPEAQPSDGPGGALPCLLVPLAAPYDQDCGPQLALCVQDVVDARERRR